MSESSAKKSSIEFPRLTPAETDKLINQLAGAVAERVANLPLLIDAPSLANRIGVSVSAIGRAVNANQIPSVQFGRRRLFDPAAVVAALAAAQKKVGEA